MASTTALTLGEANQCQGDVVYIVGAANSAGQAALELSRFAKRVVLVVRAATLTDTMSSLPDRQDHRRRPNIAVRYRSKVVAARGDGPPRSDSPLPTPRPAQPRTLPSELVVHLHRRLAADRLVGPRRRPRRAGIRGDRSRSFARRRRCAGRLTRPPFALETSVPGVFAAGDVRLNSMKRVASAVGEGAMSVYLVHRYLATI